MERRRHEHYTLDSPTRRHLWALAAVIVLSFAACGSDPTDRTAGASHPTQEARR